MTWFSNRTLCSAPARGTRSRLCPPPGWWDPRATSCPGCSTAGPLSALAEITGGAAGGRSKAAPSAAAGAGLGHGASVLAPPWKHLV